LKNHFLFGQTNLGYFQMNSIQKLIAILWDPFIKQINSGMPVFFTFHRQFLAELFKKEGIKCHDVVAFITSIANEYLDIQGDRISIKPEAFISVANQFSPVIFLVCQQVLAVEEMVNDESGYSENAYFPRLRKIISPSLGETSLNPFEYKDFSKIWKTLATEMESIDGYTKATSTISFKRIQGMNKARSFPISQALFNKEDLILICTSIGLNSILKSDFDSLWKEVLEIQHLLKYRTRRLLGLNALRERLLNQISNFSRNINEYQLKISSKRLRVNDDLELIFYTESIDWLNDEFRANLYNTKTRERIDDDNLITNYIFEYLESNMNFMILPRDVSGNHWVKSKSELEVKSGDSFLLLWNKSGISKAQILLNRYINCISLEELKNSPHKFICNEINLIEVVNKDDYNYTLFVKDGQFTKEPVKSISFKHQWHGGVCINKRSNLYFKDFLPETISFPETEFSIADVISINSKNIGFNFFQSQIDNLSEDTIFTFEFSDGNKANISIAKSNINSENFGYEVLSNNTFYPISKNLDNNEKILRGYELSDCGATATIHLSLLVKIIDALLNKKNGGTLSENQIEKIRNIAINSAPTNEIKILLATLLNKNTFLPKDLIQEIEKNI